MDLRKVSFAVANKEFKPFLELAIERHPQVIDIKLKRGNVVTAHDYARRVLIKARKEGIGKYTAEQIMALKPRLRVHVCSAGISISGQTQKIKSPAHWDNYKLPFEVMEAEDARWTTLAVNPSKEEIALIADLLVRFVFESPIELRTKFKIGEVKEIVGVNAVSLHIFKYGRNLMLWPKRTDES